MKKSVLRAFFVLLFCLNFSYADSKITVPENLFNERLTSSDRQKMENGEMIFKSIGKVKNISIKESTKTTEAIDIIKNLNPNHLAEIIQVRPYEGNEDLIERISQILKNVENYIGIPYYSERNKSWHDLYSEAEILSVKNEGNSEIIDSRFYMEPFGYYTSQIKIKNYGEYYFFTMKNTQKLRYYDDFDAVGKEKMQAAILIFRENENWIIYALGGAKIISVPFTIKRAEVSFTNRIKAFAAAIFQKLDDSRSMD